MIHLTRTKESRWILQKNISSSELIEAFVEAMREQDNKINSELLQHNLKQKNKYRGRSGNGCINTMGVRMSQMCFYMFGYKKEENFIPSPMTQMLLSKQFSMPETILVNLFSLQFPNPYSETPDDFKILFGRLLVKLLTEEKIDRKLYIDECIWFLPFIKTIDKNSYNDLIDSILEYRQFSFEKKKMLFEQVDNYNEVFSNCMHEFNYYLFRIFSGFKVINIVEDSNHNDGNLFKFKHGNSSTYRCDAYASRKKTSGYIELNKNLLKQSETLLKSYSFTDNPITQSDFNYTKEEWIREIYEFEPLKYINLLHNQNSKAEECVKIIKNMVFYSKYGSKDGKDFEYALKDCFDLFREVGDCEIISGSGDTDILCRVLNEDEKIPYKVNVDAKSTTKTTQSLNAKRLTHHIEKNGSRYCIVVSPRFASGVKIDILGEKIVTIKAEVLANYLIKECLSSKDGYANFTEINKIISSNFGTDISGKIDEHITQKYALN